LHLSKKYFEISHGPKDDFAGIAAILNERKKRWAEARRKGGSKNLSPESIIRYYAPLRLKVRFVCHTQNYSRQPEEFGPQILF
jgi:hypothetical protein